MDMKNRGQQAALLCSHQMSGRKAERKRRKIRQSMAQTSFARNEIEQLGLIETAFERIQKDLVAHQSEMISAPNSLKWRWLESC